LKLTSSTSLSQTATNPETQIVQVAAKYEGVDLELVETNPFSGVSAEYKEKFPLGLVSSIRLIVVMCSR